MRPADAVTVSVLVAVEPAAAFALFTEEIDAWWKRSPGTRFRPGRDGVLRFEPGVGGRLVEVYDVDSGDAYEVGRVVAWEPGSFLAFEWRSPTFDEHQKTLVEVRFEAVGERTRITLEHSGWDGLPQDHPVRHGRTGDAFGAMMAAWWSNLLAGLRGRAASAASPPTNPD